ncbi:porin [Candidatus Bandiella euplotis]|nr:porin [Candidatus Bandiella woodruffii]
MAAVLIGTFCTSADAKVKVKVSGSIDSQWSSIQQAEPFKYKNPSDTTKDKLSSNLLSTDARINFNVRGIAKNGLKYGGLIGLNANTSKAKKEPFMYNRDRSNIAEQVMMYLESVYGRVEIGSYNGVSSAMQVDASTFAAATGGINGDSQYYWNRYMISGNVRTARSFLQSPNLPTNDIGTVGISGVNAGKINYYTPAFSGLRVGVSFVPDSRSHGTANNVSGITRTSQGFQNVFESGILYTTEVKNVGVKVALVTELGKNKIELNKSLKAWNIGANISYRGFVFGGSYGDWGRYNVVKADAQQFGQSTYWSAGVGCAQGPFRASLTHMQSKIGVSVAGQRDTNQLRNTVLGIDYKMSPGLLPYVEFASFKMNDKSAEGQEKDGSNNGRVLLTGIRLIF